MRAHSDFDVSRETHERLNVFANLLLSWNRTIRLISRDDEPEIWSRHIADSLQLLPLLPSCIASAVDLGSGAGFPGLILAIAGKIRFTLVEADNRKAAFLREAARLTGTQVTIHAGRAETLQIAPAELVTARAVAPLARLLRWAAPLLSDGGLCVFPKGAGYDAELTVARREWHMQVECVPSRTSPHGTVLLIRNIRNVCRGAGFSHAAAGTGASDRDSQSEGRRRQDDDGD